MLTSEQVMRTNMATCGIDKALAQDRRAWKTAIRRPDPAADGKSLLELS